MIAVLSVLSSIKGVVGGVFHMNERKHPSAFAGEGHATVPHALGKRTLACSAADNGEVVRLDRSGQQIQLLTFGGRTPLLAVVS